MERYTSLYRLPENQYTAGSPVLLEAGALLKDSRTGAVLVQLKMRSVSAKPIRAVMVAVDAFDVSGAPLEGVAEYQKRLAAFANFRIIELPEEKIEEKNASDAVVKKALEKEGKAILGNVRKGAAIVAMCIEGKQISSEELAQFLADRAGSGAGDVAFVIGSSHGLADEVKRAAALKFSMGRITMPHQLARLVLTEQIYRACTINAGMKYHK